MVAIFSIKILTVGKLRERFYQAACEEYLKRLRAFCDVALLELPECRLPEHPTEAEIRQGLQREAEEIRAKIPKGAFFCVCTPEGKQLSSEELAKTLEERKSGGTSSVCFLIGSSFGVDSAIKAMADLSLSMSRMTFPHHLFRVMLLEQLYRAESIQAGTKYHK
ncbi:MAG: 23S rRNA (pseudouridine(1915)-N(3))-methyltransferase RlmH [Oscillospiraceae bacterium]|nr:23S rRNA (pseudouridine(1915)-N(3))-methyltransferase RlmH [Oscillospiraceae bacterium]